MSSSSSSSSLLSLVCRHFSLDEIKDATNNFDKSNVLGHGGEGMVYLGHIEEKYPVAVKRLNPNSIVFENEIKTVSKIQHPNVVSLLGYCNEFNQQILVYEYMERGSLSDYVKKNSRICLSWKQRLNVCLGAALGLQYLHTATDELPKGIIHRDMKPANILLERNWVAKVSDFGMFKLSHADQTNSTMNTALKGTCGYYAPEYVRFFQITRKIDVYAFGVVLFEVLCRKKPWDRGDLSYYAREDEDLGLWAKGNVDTEIHGEISDDCLEIFADIIGRSLRSNPADRPTMDEVVLDLERALVKCHEREDHEEIRPPSVQTKMIQNINEITGNSEDDEIYAMLKECSMDPIQNLPIPVKTGPGYESIAPVGRIAAAVGRITAAVGRIAQGTGVLAEGGYEKVFRYTFETVPEEQLLKSYACYLSTSTGPLKGILYMSSAKLAFCSNSPLSYKVGEEIQWSYYKVVIPLHQLKAVNPSKSKVNSAEKFIQVISVDNHEFWFMSFVHYDSAVKNLQGALPPRIATNWS